MTTAFRVSGGVLDYIRSGDWAAVGEIVRHTDLTHEKLIQVLDFLSEFKFVEFDSDKNKIRIMERSYSNCLRSKSAIL